MSASLTRRTALALGSATLASPAFAASSYSAKIAQWDMFEATYTGPKNGNPFLDIALSATFENNGKSIDAAGFYDGDGVYRIRFMPDRQGVWKFRTTSNARELDGKTGSFEVGKPGRGNHGPVKVAETYHFAYADGTPMFPIGTTSYACLHQPDSEVALTLKTLATAPFNKLRLAVFPNADTATTPIFPFPGSAHAWDFTRFNPVFFRRLDNLLAKLRDLGIEADVILFHPYDNNKWGFDAMPPEVDERYLAYLAARISAYRNIWWSLANEYDALKAKTEADWDRLFQVVRAKDPYNHLRSIHNIHVMYDNSKPWVTHASIQNGSAVDSDNSAVLYRDAWRKPVVYDEVKYEGNIAKRWGNLTGEEFVRRVWEGTIAGTYVGHGESIADAHYRMWLGEGGLLRGQSPARLAFYKKIIEEGSLFIEPIDKWQSRHMGGVVGQYYLRYFGNDTPKEWAIVLPKAELSEGQAFAVDVLDTWNMTVTPAGKFTVRKANDYDFVADRPVPMPGKPYMAVRLRKVA